MNASNSPKESDASSAGAEGGGQIGNRRILICDDKAEIRTLLRHTLGKTFELLEAENGQAALALIRRYHPLVALLDVMMPGELDGLQVLKAVRADTDLRDVHVIMLTARGQQTDIEIGATLGADMYVIKPFSPVKLARMIEEMIKGP